MKPQKLTPLAMVCGLIYMWPAWSLDIRSETPKPPKNNIRILSSTGQPAGGQITRTALPGNAAELPSTAQEAAGPAQFSVERLADGQTLVWQWSHHAGMPPAQHRTLREGRLHVLDLPVSVQSTDLKQTLGPDSRVEKIEAYKNGSGTRVVMWLKSALEVQAVPQAGLLRVQVAGPAPFRADSLALAAVTPGSPLSSLVPSVMPAKQAVRLQRWSRGVEDTGAELINLEFDSAQLNADSDVKGKTLSLRLQHAQLVQGADAAFLPMKGRMFEDARLEQNAQGLVLKVKLQGARHVIRQTGSTLQVVLVEDGSVKPNLKAVLNPAEPPALPAPLTATSHYRGKPISLNFKETDVRTVMQVFAEFSGMNLVLSDAVKGKVTVYLDQVPWDQALEIVLKSRNLVARKSGNVLLVSPQEDVAAAAAQAQVIQSSDDLDPLVQRSFQVSYQKVARVQELLEKKESKLLSSRGSVISDERTSQLFVEDTPKRVEKIGALIAQLDKPIKQVMIEARVVLADTRVSKELSAAIKAANVNALNQQSVTRNLGVDGYVDGEPGAVVNGAYTLLTSNATRFVNVQLRALESNNRVKTLSNPRVVTSNKEAATIAQGTEIPYRVATSSGATSIQFRQASLKLEVTPQIAPDGSVLLEVTVAKDSVGQQTTDGLAIDTRQVKTKVAVMDGGTVVLGGIIEKANNALERKIPLLGDIPVVGNLFKSTTKSDNEAELLIFITPVILKDS